MPAKSSFFCRKPACVAWVCFLVDSLSASNSCSMLISSSLYEKAYAEHLSLTVKYMA